MIVSLHGTLLESSPFRAVIECGGVGYEVHIPLTTTEKLPPAGNTTHLHTLQIFREDNQSLYGFASAAERDFFHLLIEKVSGIGPKTALNIFSRLSLGTLQNAIAQSNSKLLAECPGIGKKTAERLIIELRDKLTPSQSNKLTNNLSSPHLLPTSTQHDAITALISLGLKPTEADKAVRRALEKLDPEPSLEKLIRTALGN
ncbi:MAG: Holliday junction branch migration protein RuvA [Puniceicoccales bacterium]|jgi:Holliday junction DNA helicase RuvA|nr:Holliday junction branch migration protein RuvA [Puniceicoccales bacterium]